MKPDEIRKILQEELKPVKDDLAELSTRVKDVEKNQISFVQIVEMRDNIRTIEKRTAVTEGKLDKTSTKKDMQAMEKRLTKRFDDFDKGLDRDLSQTMQRVKRLEDQHPELPQFKPLRAN